jgi:hypothetical protein
VACKNNDSGRVEKLSFLHSRRCTGNGNEAVKALRLVLAVPNAGNKSAVEVFN